MKPLPLILTCAVILALVGTAALFTKQQTKNVGTQEQADTKGLTPIQYYVTQENGTEKPYENEYWDFHDEGIYVDVVSGEPLFSSLDKYDSKTGWPSFTRTINESAVTLHEDKDLGYTRIEVRSAEADSHLGHLFEDGPKEKGGKRFCMNSAALRFVPRDELAKEGLGEYEKLFTNS